VRITPLFIFRNIYLILMLLRKSIVSGWPPPESKCHFHFHVVRTNGVYSQPSVQQHLSSTYNGYVHLVPCLKDRYHTVAHQQQVYSVIQQQTMSSSQQHSLITRSAVSFYMHYYCSTCSPRHLAEHVMQ